MPTIQQLPRAVQVNSSDEVMLDQSGSSVSASVAQVLAAGQTITLTGDVTGSGSSTVLTTLAPVATPGTYGKVSVNAKGLVTGGSALAGADVVGALGYTPYSAANPAGYVAGSALAPVAVSGRYGDLTGQPALGSLSAQAAGAVAITGGSIAGADVSAASVTVPGSPAARTLAARAAATFDVLDYGADPTGAADSAPAFAAAMAAVPAGGTARLTVPRGTYKLNSYLNQPSGKSISAVFTDGATITGPGGLGVSQIDSHQGSFSLSQGGGGWFGFNPVLGSPLNPPFRNDIVQNTPQNSAATRVGWNQNYANYNYYGKYVNGIDLANQGIYSWPHLYDNSSGWGHWEVIFGTQFDEDSMQRAHISASSEFSEYDVVNNGPEFGWTWKAGFGTPVQGISVDPWGQNGNYGGGLLFAYGSVGSYDGNAGGLNWRWPNYPAVFSTGNPPAVAQNSTIVVTFDATAKGSATLGGGGVTSVSVTAGGGVYTSPPGVVFTGGGGSGAAGTAVMLGQSVVGVAMTASGSGYTSAPAVSFTGGGVATPVATTVTLNSDGAHGDLASVAAAINAAGVPLVRAAVSPWGGVVNRLVIFGTAGFDQGTLTLGGTALAALGIAAQAYTTPRDTMAVVFGSTGGCLATDKLTLNGTVITVGGAGAQADVIHAINSAGLPGITADSTATGNLVITCWVPQNPGGLIVSQPGGYATLGKLGLAAGTFWPPTPPKGFATAAGELTAPVCLATDKLSIAATDLNGTSYGPVTVQLNGGAGTGWPVDVVASIQAALTSAGFYSSGWAQMTAAPAVVAVGTHAGGGNQGVIIRNTAGGTLTLANVSGTPLATLGMVAGTYQPGGYSAASQSVFMAAEDSIAPQGRGIFLGGASNATDRTVLPHTPLEARGSFLHGLRTDKASFDDNTAVLVGATQAIGFGSAVSLTASGTALAVNGAPVALVSAVPTRTSQLTNDAGFISSAPVSSVAGRTGAVTLGTADIAGFAAAAAAAAPVQSVLGRSGAVTLGSADVTGALGYTPLSSAGGTLGGTVTLSGTITGGTITGGTISGAALAGTLAGAPTLSGAVAFTGAATAVTQTAADNSTRLATTGFVYQTTAGVSTIATTGGSTTLTAAQYGVPVLIVTGALTSAATLVVPTAGVWTVANRTTGGFTLTIRTAAGSGVAVDQNTSAELVADGSNVVLATSDFSGITLLGTTTNSGTISGGSLAGTIVNTGTIMGGVLSSDTLTAGTFTGTITNNGTISGGALAGSITNTATLNTAVISGTLTVGSSSTTDVLSISTGNGVYFRNNIDTADAHFYFTEPNGTLFVIDNADAGTIANYVQTRARTTGNDPQLIAAGGDANISLLFQGKGTGVIKTASALQINSGGTIAAGTTLTNSGVVSGGTIAPAVLTAGNAGSTMTVSQLTDSGGYTPIVVANSGSNTNIPLVLAPAGAGYIAAALSNGTASGGNQRGQYAVDWQQTRAANTQVASGSYAVVAGGANNTASGSYSFAAGQNNTASGQGSVALGQFATDGGAYGKLVFSGYGNTVGNQWGVTTLFVSSVVAATRMTSDGNAAGAANTLPIRSNHVVAGTLTVTARNVSTGDGAYWSIPVLYKNSAGTVSVTSPGTAGIAPTVADSSLSTASIVLAADNTNKGLSVTITPPASVTISASAAFLATEM